jgi:hypothetical protein
MNQALPLPLKRTLKKETRKKKKRSKGADREHYYYHLDEADNIT